MEFLTGGNEGCAGCGPAQISCTFCAACCTGGGPVLRTQDERLVKTGKISLAQLYTQRAGELMFNRATMKMEPLAADQIKIKVAEGSLSCHFLDPEKRCTIYAQRPFECRSFKCWDPSEIQTVYASDLPLSREDIIGGIEGLWDLVSDHHARCSYQLLGELIRAVESRRDPEAMAKVSEMIAYDRSLRASLSESGRVKAEILDFLLGRPLTTTIVMFDYRIENVGGADTLVSVK